MPSSSGQTKLEPAARCTCGRPWKGPAAMFFTCGPAASQTSEMVGLGEFGRVAPPELTTEIPSRMAIQPPIPVSGRIGQVGRVKNKRVRDRGGNHDARGDAR